MKKRKWLKFQAFTSTLSCTLVLVLVGMMVLSVLTARNIGAYMRENFIMTLTLGGSNDAVLGTEEGAAVQITAMLGSLKCERFVKDASLVSAEEVLQQQMEVIGGNPEEFLGFNPYYNEMEVDLYADYVNQDSLNVITKELQTKYPLVSEVNYERSLMESLGKNIQRLSVVLLTLATLLLIILFALINNMVHLSIFARRFQIHTMKLVGASWWFIRRPFIVRSLWIGLVAGILACLVLLGIARWLMLEDELLGLCITGADLFLTALVVIPTGIALLALTTYVSVNHFLRMKEENLHS